MPVPKHTPSTYSPSRYRALAITMVFVAVLLWVAIAVLSGGRSPASQRMPVLLPPATGQQAGDQPGTQPGAGSASGGAVAEPPAAASDTTDPAQSDGQPDDQPAPDPDDPDPDDPDPGPQVPVGGNGQLAPNPTSPVCLPSCVAPVDLHPIETPQGNPAANVGIAGSDTAGCSVDCITRAQAFLVDGSTDVMVEVETHTQSFIKIYVDDQSPAVTPAGRPYFPGIQAVAHTTGDLDTEFSATITELKHDTTYWFVVTATDQQARSTDVTGTITTPFIEPDDDDVEVVFTGIDLWYDGDHGSNKGELDFEWHIGSTVIGGNGTYHRGNGSHIDLGDQTNSWAHVDLEGAVPPIQLYGVEHDPTGVTDFCSAGGITHAPGKSESCGMSWNSIVPYSPTLAEIAELPLCDSFPLDDEFDGYRCAIVGTHESGNGIPEFTAVIAFLLF
ncbi:MAG: hypothetical protein Q7V88_07890 [Actinomycetota bacterium]|nr:hypothetical protein [Actinomycetota bacterium]